MSEWPPLSPGEPRSFGNGRYVVQRRLGAGNFATVYLAHDDRLDVMVAVKLLSDRWSWEPEVRGRFVQEARLLRSMNDALVVQIRDIAETEDGRPYLVMDFATEGTLEQRMLELTQQGVRVSPFHLRVTARAIADALGVLHERRIAHRDIKPSNMLITRATTTAPPLDPERASALGIDQAVLRPGERLMLGDLGLAKDLAFDSGITVGVGTAGYMAPEQALAGAKIDMRTDIFAATALLAQIASGEPPDPVRRVSGGRIETGRPLPANIAPVLAQALLRGLDADPDQRPQTIEQWLVEVDRALISLETNRPFAPPTAPVPFVAPVPAPLPAPLPAPGGGSSGPDRARTRQRALVVVGAVVAVGVIGVGAVLLGGGGSDGPNTSDVSTPIRTTVEVDTSGGIVTDPSVSDPAVFTVQILGPTTVHAGVEAHWDVLAPGAVGGTWALTGPVRPSPSKWTPGDGFTGTWNDPNTITLTLNAVDGSGRRATRSITFVVE